MKIIRSGATVRISPRIYVVLRLFGLFVPLSLAILSLIALHRLFNCMIPDVGRFFLFCMLFLVAFVWFAAVVVDHVLTFASSARTRLCRVALLGGLIAYALVAVGVWSTNPIPTNGSRHPEND